jgi:TetR/AcrR family transcriptional regulator
MGIQERKQREREQRKSMIVDCAMQIFAEKGIAATSMDEVAAKAEFSKATLYLYFKNKEELAIYGMLRVVKSFTDLLRTRMAEADDDLGKMNKVGVAYLEYYYSYPQYYQLLNSTENVGEMDNPDCEVCQELKALTLEIWEIICTPIMALVEKGVFKPDTNAVEMGMLLWAGSSGVINVMNHVDCTHRTDQILLAEKDNPFLYQMNRINFEAMLHRLWDGIVQAYLNQ